MKHGGGRESNAEYVYEGQWVEGKKNGYGVYTEEEYKY
jgi:hypothetical protein